ncbi:MAG TPA: hypothetical protein DCX54_02235 [Flavobacteriales bacterium]|nr:hypothetical protein [Flavobacteriales bacterium]
MFKVKNEPLRIMLLFLVPFVIAYFSYWGPVWTSETKDKSGEFGAWAIAFIGPWAFICFVAMLLGLLVFSRIDKLKNKNG